LVERKRKEILMTEEIEDQGDSQETNEDNETLRDERYKKLLKDKERLIKERMKRVEKITRLASFMIAFSTLTLVAVLFNLSGEGSRYVRKSDIKTSVVKAIENGADLRAIKNIFENRNIQKWGIKNIFSEMHEYYKLETPLSKVLEDIRSGIYETDTDKKGVFDSLNSIILEHQERNPFDALEQNQKDYFENIRLRSGEQYSRIQNEVDKLATELESKNALVNKYLKQSTTSFWVSIIALIFSLSIGVFQIFQSRSSRLRLFIASALEESDESVLHKSS